MSTEAQLIRELAAESPGVARLARAVSLAVLVEPQLLRRARIELLRDVEAGAEADLWLSPLVQTRSPRGIVLRPRAAELLRRQLAEDAALFKRAWALTFEMHRGGPPTVLLEEEINQLSVRLEGDSLEQVEKLLNSVTNTLMREDGRRGLANWAASALARLPEEVRRLDAARVLAAVSYLRLSDHLLPAPAESSSAKLPEWLSWALPKDLPTFELGVRLVEGGVQFGDAPESGRSINVPGTNPLLVELSWTEDRRERVRQVRLARGERVKVETPPGVVRLRTAHGQRYVINPVTTRASARTGGDEAARETCFVVMGFGRKTDFETGRTLDLDASYHNMIKPAVEAAGLRCVRADEIPHKGVIDVPLYEHLLNADVVIADLSTSNKNAYYELGVRHALRPHTTIIICEDRVKTFFFDVNYVTIRQYRHMGEGVDFDEVRRFSQLLTGAIVNILSQEPRPVDSPVYTFLKGLRPPELREPAEEGVVAQAEANQTGAGGARTLGELMREADEAQKSADFVTAKSLLAHARRLAATPGQPEDPSLLRRFALVTYKSKLPNPRAALEEARDLLQALDPATTNDAETLELWGAVHKRLWDETKDARRLDEAVRGYERGFYVRNDYYNGINLAYLLNVRAHEASPRAEAATSADEDQWARAEAVACFVYAERVRREVLSICEAELKTNQPTGDKRYWVLATMAEAYLGVGDESNAMQKMEEASSVASEPWMSDATQEQMDKLRRLLADSPLKYIMTNGA